MSKTGLSVATAFHLLIFNSATFGTQVVAGPAFIWYQDLFCRKTKMHDTLTAVLPIATIRHPSWDLILI